MNIHDAEERGARARGGPLPRNEARHAEGRGTTVYAAGTER